MKKLLFSLFLVLQGTMTILAQKTEAPTPTTVSNDSEIRKATEALTAKYSLNADQAKQMYTIQVRKAKNMASIASLQSSNPALYRAKLQNVQTATSANIRRILQQKEQVDIYQKTQSELRTLRNQKKKEMHRNKATQEEIELAMLAIYAE